MALLDSDTKAAWRYKEELPANAKNLDTARQLLESYSNIPSDQVVAHITAVRDKAYTIYPYPCIGRWRFLDIYLPFREEYPDILAHLQSGDRLLDVGCCFGQILRQLVRDGIPAANLAGTDLRPEFIELGYDLFRDKDTFGATFVTGDIFDTSPDSEIARQLDGRFDILHVASFFHLFGWDDQVRVGERLVRFFRTGRDRPALVVGRQMGSRQPSAIQARLQDEVVNQVYRHNVESMQRLWDEIGQRTGTQWKVTGELFETEVEDESRTLIQFAVKSLSK